MTAMRSNRGDLAKWYELQIGCFFCRGKAEYVGRSEKTSDFSSRGWPREKAEFHQRPGNDRNVLRRRRESDS